MPFGLGGGVGRALGLGKKPGNTAGRQGGMFGPNNMPMSRGRNMGQAASNMGSFITGMQRPSNAGGMGGTMGAPSSDFMSRFGSMVPGGGFAGGGMQNKFFQQPMQGMDPNMATGQPMQPGGGMFGPSQGFSGAFGMRKPFGSGGGY